MRAPDFLANHSYSKEEYPSKLDYNILCIYTIKCQLIHTTTSVLECQPLEHMDYNVALSTLFFVLYTDCEYMVSVYILELMQMYINNACIVCLIPGQNVNFWFFFLERLLEQHT